MVILHEATRQMTENGCKYTTKLRRDYQMAPKVTISRRRDRRFNITNSR